MEQKISDEIKAMAKILGFNSLEMVFVMKEDLQTYTLYERGKFDATYSVRKDHLRAKLILMVDLLQDRVDELKAAKAKLITYKKNGIKGKSIGTTGRKPKISPLTKHGENGTGKVGTKSGTSQYVKPVKQG